MSVASASPRMAAARSSNSPGRAASSARPFASSSASVTTQPSALRLAVERHDVPERRQLGAARRELRDLLGVLRERDHRARVGEDERALVGGGRGVDRARRGARAEHRRSPRGSTRSGWRTRIAQTCSSSTPRARSPLAIARTRASVSVQVEALPAAVDRMAERLRGRGLPDALQEQLGDIAGGRSAKGRVSVRKMAAGLYLRGGNRATTWARTPPGARLDVALFRQIGCASHLTDSYAQHARKPMTIPPTGSCASRRSRSTPARTRRRAPTRARCRSTRPPPTRSTAPITARTCSR